MNITAIVILGLSATTFYNNEHRIPTSEELEKLGGSVLEKEFDSEDKFKGYLQALEDSDEWLDYLVVEVNYGSPEAKTINDKIIEILKWGPLSTMYFLLGINVLRDHINEVTDEQIIKLFSNLIHPTAVRNSIEQIYNKLNKIK